MPAKTPQDHRPKDDDGFTFTVRGKKYHLPPVSEKAAGSVPFGVTEDAIMYPDDPMKQLALGFHMLRETDAEPAARAALRSLSTTDAVEIVGQWLGEASGSSD